MKMKKSEFPNTMETNKTTSYIPSVPVHPFDIVEDEIAARGLTKKEFAESIGMKPSNFSRMLKKKGELTSEMALKLEAALDIPYRHWMRYQEQYIKDCSRLNLSYSNENRVKESSHPEKRIDYEDIYLKISLAIRPVKERMESINALISNRERSATDYLTKEQISSIENDVHSLGRALCELRLS